jgi:hypothetical protein
MIINQARYHLRSWFFRVFPLISLLAAVIAGAADVKWD